MSGKVKTQVQPIIRNLSARVPVGLRRRLFGNAMEDRLSNLSSLGFAPSQIVDIGAYIGRWTEMAGSIFPSANILMLEAQENKREILSKLVEDSRGRFQMEICLLSDAEKDVEFYEMETGSSIYSELTSVDRVTVEKQSKTLEGVLKAQGVSSVDLLKLDVQGAELDILSGAGGILETVKVIAMEVSVRPYNKGAPLFSEVISFMTALGFQCFDMCELKREKATDFAMQLDLFFQRIDRPIFD